MKPNELMVSLGTTQGDIAFTIARIGERDDSSSSQYQFEYSYGDFDMSFKEVTIRPIAARTIGGIESFDKVSARTFRITFIRYPNLTQLSMFIEQLIAEELKQVGLL